MIANDFRIGNIINTKLNTSLDEKNLKVIAIYPDRVILDLIFSEITLFYEEIKLITLTEEWLFKFGFEKHEDRYFHEFDYVIFYLTNKTYVLVSNYSDPRNDDAVRIEYVHQLQNLYFALTGQELELK